MQSVFYLSRKMTKLRKNYSSLRKLCSKLDSCDGRFGVNNSNESACLFLKGKLSLVSKFLLLLEIKGLAQTSMVLPDNLLETAETTISGTIQAAFEYLALSDQI